MRPAQAEAIFGGFDGSVSLVGLIAGAIVAHASPHVLLVVAGGAAVSSAVSMAGGDRLAGKSWRLSAVMGAATFAGSLLPAAPIILIPGVLGVALAALLLAGLGAGIAEVRAHGTPSRGTAYRSTFAMLLVASGLAAAVTIGLGATG